MTTSPPRVFIVDDDELIVTMLARALRKEGYQTRGAESLAGLTGKIEAWSPDVVMLDVNLPEGSGLDALREIQDRGLDTEVVMLTADDTASTAIRAVKLGAADYLTKPFDVDEVKAVLRNLLEKRRLKREVEYFRRNNAAQQAREFVGESAPMQELREHLLKLAGARVNTILLTGESGTGKELVARHLHALTYGETDSADSPFVGINCASLPANLIESELFGYERGAFTDAKSDKKGVFELAEGGTLLLDEIGELPFNLQSKLLRILEERIVRRIGGKQDIPLRVRVIAATNRDLAREVAMGQFREDLLYRLNAFAVNVPPLRDRGGDIVQLAYYFLGKFSAKYNKKRPRAFSAETEAILTRYRWPGNVRELRNTVERMVVLEGPEIVEPSDLPREIAEGAGAQLGEERAVTSLPDDGLSMDEVKKNLIVSALKKTGNNRAQAARLLQITYDTLRYQLKKYKLD
jgi:DNA-binding NtrC family response regulator